MSTETEELFSAALSARLARGTTGGLPSGTIVLTMDGEMPVEHLAPGDRIVTREGGMARIREIRVLRQRIAPVRVRAGTFGHARPGEDTLLSPATRVHLRDWRARALYGAATADMPAGRLVDGTFVLREAAREMRLHDVVLDRPQTLYAGGLELRSA
ncbi:Hint domain-containing protein [Wenxinia saemankumensis]|nr:Hint domain-containing protein [Wenxinia saemankumensis]